MELIIDITEETVTKIKDNVMFACTIPSEILWDVTSAIVNGIPRETVTEFTDRCRECGAKYGKLLKQEPCDNAVSRQAALDAMYELCNTGETLEENPWRDNPHIDAIIDAINNLPPVNPQEPKSGHWIHRTQDGGCFWEECSVCHTERAFSTKYCPDCGTYMYADIRAGEAESEDKE